MQVNNNNSALNYINTMDNLQYSSMYQEYISSLQSTVTSILGELAKYPGSKLLELQRFWYGHIRQNKMTWIRNGVKGDTGLKWCPYSCHYVFGPPYLWLSPYLSYCK